MEKYIPEVIEAIEDSLFGQIEVAIPIYISVEMAHEDGLKVMLTGQGADELFAGYPWYRTIVEKDGYNSLKRYMVGDVLNLYRETLEREDKITMVNAVELRVPYLDPKVIKIAMQIDDKLKIRSPKDELEKLIHMELAKRIRIPADLAERPKKAAQHGSGIHEAILVVAQKNGFTEDLVILIRFPWRKDLLMKLN
ncbi:MAG TPA: hypothetical protein EYP30_00025 [Archaeoglobaceae archaeon]|nr:hypothetical protein [Archaeoglobaceae archaeon]